MTTTLAPEISHHSTVADTTAAPAPDTIWRHVFRSGRVMIGGGILLVMVLLCVVTLPWTTAPANGKVPFYQVLNPDAVRKPPSGNIAGWFGYDNLGRSVLARCLVGGTISLAVGLAAATISVLLGVAIGLLAGYRGGWLDSALMRFVDIMYGLPYILLVILFKIALEDPLKEGIRLSTLLWLALLIAALVMWAIAPAFSLEPSGRRAMRIGAAAIAFIALAGVIWGRGSSPKFYFGMRAETANLVVLFFAIGLVSWLTMSRVVRGQVLSLREQPFVEACRAMGLKERRIFARHILPNLVGPITVYATLTVPSAILQESFLSFLGVGVNPPLATWGSLAAEGVEQLSPLKFYWWLLLFPCTLLAVTLLSLNFLGDGLRDVFDPKKEAAKI
jgi:ABC-type dipeptide/oligopeptide/nickel transport system permease subunit